MAIIMDGKAFADGILDGLALRVAYLKVQGITPSLRVVQVGDDPASASYVSSKARACGRVGIDFRLDKLDPLDTVGTTEYIDELLYERSILDHFSGTILQLPIPAYLHNAEQDMPATFDVDGLSTVSAGRLFQGHNDVFYPCTAKGILELLRHYNVPLKGKHAVVVGRSNIAGKPVSMLLLKEDCTVTICHSKTENLFDYTRQADILIVAVGKPNLIDFCGVKPGAAVIDVGINRLDGKLCGDVNFESVAPYAGWITPVPGGVGPMTVAMLMENVVRAAELQGGNK